MRRCLSVYFIVLLLAGCASHGFTKESVGKQISNAELMIRQARQNKAEDYAPLDLKLAEERLEEAKAALKDNELEKAGRNVEMAMEQARLADAKAETARAKKEVQQEKKDVETLRDEINRAVKQQ